MKMEKIGNEWKYTHDDGKTTLYTEAQLLQMETLIYAEEMELYLAKTNQPTQAQIEADIAQDVYKQEKAL